MRVRVDEIPVDQLEPIIEGLEDEFHEDLMRYLVKAVASDKTLIEKLIDMLYWEIDEELAEKYRKRLAKAKNIKRVVEDLLDEVYDAFDEIWEIENEIFDKYKDTLICRRRSEEECREMCKHILEEDDLTDLTEEEKRQMYEEEVAECMNEYDCEFDPKFYKQMVDEAVQKVLDWIRSDLDEK